jgi:hypothetical protein
MQDRIFVLRVLFGLMMTQSNHVDDDATEMVLAAEWYHHLDMLVMMLGDSATESVLAITRKGTAADSQGAVIDRQGATADCQHTDVDRQGATIDHQGAITGRQGATVDRLDAAVDH